MELASVLPATVFNGYLRSRMELLESQKRLEMEGEMQAKISMEVERLVAMEQQQRMLMQARRHIEDEILLTRCPRQVSRTSVASLCCQISKCSIQVGCQADSPAGVCALVCVRAVVRPSSISMAASLSSAADAHAHFAHGVELTAVSTRMPMLLLAPKSPPGPMSCTGHRSSTWRRISAARVSVWICSSGPSTLKHIEV